MGARAGFMCGKTGRRDQLAFGDAPPSTIRTFYGLDFPYVNDPVFGVGRPQSVYPFLADLDEITKWAFRVKKWQFSGSVTYNFESPDPPYSTKTETLTFQIGFWWGALFAPEQSFSDYKRLTHEPDTCLFENGPVSSAAEFVMQNGTIISNDDPLAIIDPSSTYSGTTLPSFGVLVYHRFQSAYYLSSESSFVPLVILYAGAYSSGGDPSNDNHAGSGFVDGNEVQLWTPPPHSFAFPYDYNIVAADCSLDGLEFWPYANSKGQQVYDINSGAQLVDPFS